MSSGCPSTAFGARSVRGEVFSPRIDPRLAAFAVLDGVAFLDGAVGEGRLLDDVLGRAKRRQILQSGDLPDTAADAQHHEIFALISLELVEPVLGDHHAFVLADDRGPAIAESEGGLAL